MEGTTFFLNSRFNYVDIIITDIDWCVRCYYMNPLKCEALQKQVTYIFASFHRDVAKIETISMLMCCPRYNKI